MGYTLRSHASMGRRNDAVGIAHIGAIALAFFQGDAVVIKPSLHIGNPASH
jgi:hypothetical protein